MASAKAGVHVVQLKPIVVPKALQDGHKFSRWDDDSVVSVPVTLRVDKKGYFLYWTSDDHNKETEFLEISSIRDTRTGRYAKLPREGKLKDSLGTSDASLEDRTLTVVYGPDLVNVNFINFVATRKDIAIEWADELLKMAYNLLAMNASVYAFLEKTHTKILLMTDREGRLPIKNIMKMFAQHKDDKKRVERSLELCGLPSGKNDTILPEKFSMSLFFTFYQHLIGRTEVTKIYDRICGNEPNTHKKKLMTVDQLVEFLNKEQRDPRLNEILYPYADRTRGRDIIHQYEPNKLNAQKGLLSVEGFLRYLMSDDNAIVAPEKFDLNLDMDQPMSHYFINSSHNTYLTGHQLTGKSSVEVYRQSLLAGCRCIELDCWNGRNSDEEPIITHGYTVVTEISLKEVLEAISESSFKTSCYPVILSFENHCSPKQQAKIAYYCRKIFGDMLVTEPLASYQLKPGIPLPSPNSLLRKIIIKNKKKHHVRTRKSRSQQQQQQQIDDQHQENTSSPSAATQQTPERRPTLVTSNSDESSQNDNDDVSQLNGNDENTTVAKSSSCDIDDLDSDSSLEEEEVGPPEEQIEVQGTAMKESEAGAEMSALVIYVQPIRFHSFEYAEKRNRSFEVSSFVETQATSLLKERPVEFVNFNKRQLSRIYPKGTRVDSSNYMPQVFWNAGCQMVALNFQTLDLGMQLNLGIFEYNGRSGYLLKPDFMRRQDRKFDPFTESTVDGIIAGTVTIKVISGHFLTEKRVGTFVEIDMYGLPADTVRRKRTRIYPANGLNPVYDEEPFVFKKVVLPDLACLRIAVFEENGKFIGTRILPVVGLRPGYRHISLRNESGQPLAMPTLFVHITVKDYVPDGLSELADALANPIAYQSMVEKHAKQLLALTDEAEETVISTHIESTPKAAGNTSPEHPNVRRGVSEEIKLPSASAARDSVDLTSSTSASTAKHDNVNGNVQKSSEKAASNVSSPVHRPSVPPLLRQDTLTMRLNPSARSLSDDGPLEKCSVLLLESSEANIVAESLEKIKESKYVQKVMSKLDRDLQAIRKKYEKLRDKEREVILQKAEKLNHAQEKHKSAWAKSHSKLGKKSASTDGTRTRRQSLQFLVSMPSYRHLMKRRSEVDLQNVLSEHQAKLEELNRSFSQSMLNLTQEQFRAELDLYDKYHEQMCSAIEKAMHQSQSAQIQHLQGLHDQEVSQLMKRLESQTKDELAALSKKHKDKNELARIKRELQQKLIEQAVSERQRFSCLLEKRRSELEGRHEEVRKKFEEEKSSIPDKRRKEYEEKRENLLKEFQENPSMFTATLQIQAPSASGSQKKEPETSKNLVKSLRQETSI